MKIRTIRGFAVVASVALVLGAFVAGPAEAKKKKCAGFTPAVEGAKEVPVVKVTPKHTEAAPLTVELEHEAALYPAHTEDKYVNIQVVAPPGGLYIREEFSSNHDIDLYLFDSAGEEAASSGAFNPAPVPGLLDAGGNGGTNFESIPGHAFATCSGWTINSHAYLTPGTEATVKIWLGAPAA